ncbi:hypothetical protein GALMADRAFT_227249 [Galerina marginata CBS 339.88]|uniref:Uncharacterized protein n=1 Tax=Galerina marginata (strain CBS 339.88) TaxID=685588 RepID=A0A067T7E4_GALM3|nr:hypothetical protein GALMADRAFT_227249 [Galerina marginata CBS 339.88]
MKSSEHQKRDQLQFYFYSAQPPSSSPSRPRSRPRPRLPSLSLAAFTLDSESTSTIVERSSSMHLAIRPAIHIRLPSQEATQTSRPVELRTATPSISLVSPPEAARLPCVRTAKSQVSSCLQLNQTRLSLSLSLSLSRPISNLRGAASAIGPRLFKC